MPRKSIVKPVKVAKNTTTKGRGRPKKIAADSAHTEEETTESVPETINNSQEIVEHTCAENNAQKSTAHSQTILQSEDCRKPSSNSPIKPQIIENRSAHDQNYTVQNNSDTNEHAHNKKIRSRSKTRSREREIDSRHAQNNISEKTRILGPNETAQTEDNQPSKFIHVSNLTRPFMISDLQTMINEGKSIRPEDFWIDEIKSHCYVQCENIDCARAIIERLNGSRWPEHNKKLLLVEFADCEKMLNDTRGKFNNTADHHHAANEHPPEIVVENMDNVQKNSGISDLFRKTCCEPHIYWLPSNKSEEVQNGREVKVEIDK